MVGKRVLLFGGRFGYGERFRYEIEGKRSKGQIAAEGQGVPLLISGKVEGNSGEEGIVLVRCGEPNESVIETSHVGDSRRREDRNNW